MKKWFRWVAGIAVLGLGALQLTNPPLTNPPVVAGHDLLALDPPPADIVALLKSSCYNCHSFETKWPWYSHVAPFSWRLADHVDDARSAMNFSDWPHEYPSRVRKRWRHIANEVEDGEMPLRSYTWIHPESRLTATQRARLVQWARTAGP